MRIIPNSTITLYSKVDIDNGEQLVFSTREKQAAYFATKAVRTITDCQYVKKTGRIRVAVSGSLISTCNYLSFVNPSFDNKVFYCKIVDYDFINNETCEISWYLDIWQTYMHDVTFDDMHIERQHLSVTDFNKAEINPYDPTIYEFRTPENELAIGRDVEKMTYSVGSDDTTDGFYLRQAVSTFANVGGEMGTLLYLSEIDFEDLDDSAPAGSSAPSSWYVQMLEAAVTGTGHDYGFYKITRAQYDYLIGKYPSANIHEFATGSGWTTLGVVPLGSNLIIPGYNVIYIPSNSNWVSGLLTHLTQWNCVSAIIGLYGIPNNLMVAAGLATSGPGTEGSFYATQKTAKTKLSVHNKKLMLYPFSYMRLIAPNGDIKELRYESFEAVQQGNDACRIDFNLDITEKPTLIVAPDGYMMTGLSPETSNMNANLREGLIFNQFPSLPYTIDSFLSQISALSASIIGNNTTEYGYNLEQKQLDIYKEGVSNAASGVAMIGNITSGNWSAAVANGVNATFGATQTELNQRKFQNEANMSQDAYGALAGEQEGNAVYDNYKHCRAAFAANRYIPSNGDGTINYNLMSMLDIIVLRVSLNSVIAQEYDKWFTAYGYNNSGRVGIPYVLNFINERQATWDDTVHWETLNGRECTYVKTADAKVLHSMLPVQQYIAGMLNSGIRLYKGDLT